VNEPWRYPPSVPASRVANWWRRRRAERKRLAYASARFDLRWARWLLTLSVPLTAANFLRSHPALDWTAAVGTGVFAVLLCLYFGWLLFGRLQCSLLELLVLVGFLGHVEGLVLTTPRLASMSPGSWALAPLLAGWVLYGAVVTLAQARILALERPVPRLLLLAANWLVLATPALIVAGVLLRCGGQFEAMVSPDMAAWSTPLLAAGGVGCVLFVWLSVTTRRSAREIFGLVRRKGHSGDTPKGASSDAAPRDPMDARLCPRRPADVHP